MSSVAVYTFKNAAGDVLYVGQSMNLGGRLQEHAKRELWDQVKDIEVDWVATVDEAKAVEAERIASLGPTWNKVGGRHEKRGARMIRLPLDVDQALVRESVRLDVSINLLIEVLVRRWLEDLPAAPDPAEDRPGLVQEHGALVGAMLDCPHPRTARQVYSWGSKCGSCGVRL